MMPLTFIRKYGFGIFALLSLFLFAIPCSAAGQTGQPGRPEQGRKLFNQICVKCHAADGSGDTPIGKAVGAKDLRRPEAQKLTDTEIFTQIDKGNGNMPSLSDAINQAREDDLKERVNDLVAYIRELGKKTPTAKKP
jgi:mono/diheme cytochrome c family protein